MSYDLDQATAPDWELTFRGQPFTVVGDLPLEALAAGSRVARLADQDVDPEGIMDAIRGFVAQMFRDPADVERFLALRPGMSALLALFRESNRRATGEELGEALAPSASSNGGGDPLPQISSGTTAST